MESMLNLSEILEWLHSLDVARISGHPRGVKSPLLLLFILIMNANCQSDVVPLSMVPKRNIVPMEVKERAQAAVQEVVNKTIRGDFQAALDSMNPDYLKVIARPFGGPKRLKAQYLKQMKEMGQNGVTFQAAITRRADIAFEVDYGFEDLLVDGKKVMGEDGEPKKVARYRKWMVFVPTVKDFQYLDQSKKPTKLRRFRKWEYEIAISPKGQESWTFVNGNGINALQLRKIFKFLPKEDKEFQFPEVKVEELE
ncbi:MAG TPA: hypothetical protein DIS80_11955 [Verrucomicrobiales bacterium]|nr:hypothetical protein [Verrucomicrobiales bacterium]